jgi:Uncharacterized protein conserved in bacteria
MREVALSGEAWPDRIRKISNAFQNQFELPVIFYLLVGLILITNSVDGILVWLAWGFVATRCLHALIHTTTNVVLHRFYAYLAGFILLAAMWIYFLSRIL